MPCQDLAIMGNNLGLTDLLVYPTTCFYHFYTVIFAALFLLIAFFLYNKEKEDLVKADAISALGTSASAILFLALIATLVTSTNGIVMLQRDIFLYIVGIWIVLIGIWFFKK